MRIAVVNWSNRRFGGTGTYLSAVMPALQSAGHEVSLWHEVDVPAEHPVLPTSATAAAWSVSTLGLDAAIDALREWRPDVLYSHGLLEPSVERRTLDVAPAVFFAHDYYGTCISGLKTFTNPVVTPCNRRFGWQCLAAYYPRRCGGLSPVTMVRQFRLQHDRLELLSRYRVVVTHSGYMQREYVKHGLAPARVINVGYGSILKGSVDPTGGARGNDRPWRLLFVGRMDRLKGGAELLRALPGVAQHMGREVHLTFAGDGPERSAWQALAAEICQRDSQIQIGFPGWIGRDALEDQYARSDLLVLPSLWPEPLALVGLEAARHRVPVVAFDVGGVSEWLRSGENGILAPGDPPTVEGLATAIVAALHNPDVHARLVEGAGKRSADFSFDLHVQRLMQVFENVVQ